MRSVLFSSLRMRSVLFSSLFLLFLGGVNCGVQHCQIHTTDTCVFRRCISQPQQQIGCVAPDGRTVECGSTHTINYPDGTAIGYYCPTNPNPTGPNYVFIKSTTCNHNNVEVTVGSTVVVGNTNKQCVRKPNGDVEFQTTSCHYNGKTVPVGSTCQECNQQQDCTILRCESNGGKTVTLTPIVCKLQGGEEIPIGKSQNIFHNPNSEMGFQYACEVKGQYAISVPKACVTRNGGFASIGQTITVGNSDFLCTMENNVIQFKINACRDRNNQKVNEGASVTLMEQGNMGFVYTCTRNGDSLYLAITGCATHGTTVNVGGIIKVDKNNYQCLRHPDNTVQFKLITCRASNGQELSIGESTTIFQTGSSVGYVYTCEENGNGVILKATGCAAPNGNTVTVGQSIICGDVSYTCSWHGQVVQAQPNGCVNNGQVVVIGGNCQVCQQSVCYPAQCVNSGQGPVLQPLGCDIPSGGKLQVGATKTVFTDNSGMGFVYKCELQGNVLSYAPIACVVRNNNQEERIPAGHSFTYQSFVFICNKDGSSISYKPTGCVSNGRTIAVGNEDRVCTNNNQQCTTSQCYQDGNGIKLRITGCTFGSQTIVIGGQCVWQNQRCFCDANGGYCR